MSRKGRVNKPAKPSRKASRKSASKPAIRPRPTQAIPERDLQPARWIAANAAVVMTAGVTPCQ